MTTELYKKYRPKSLDRIVGNEETVKSLANMLVKNGVPHTILLSGPSGCGKTTLARILAKSLGCVGGDLCEMNCSSERSIDSVREIMRVMNLAPTGGTCRVWILDEVHQLSKDAQHSALKMLEDTPRHVYFFLCTTDPGKLLPTIRSRCTSMPVKLLSGTQVEFLIRRVAKKEGIDLSEDSGAGIVDACGGSARQALVLLDKIRHLPASKQGEALKTQAEEEREAIELCRALIKKSKWSFIAKILKGIKTEPEQVRWNVLGYAKTLLLSGNSQAFFVIQAFENNFFDSKEAGLVRACYEAIHGE